MQLWDSLTVCCDPWKPKIILQLGLLLWLTAAPYWYLYPHSVSAIRIKTVTDRPTTRSTGWLPNQLAEHNWNEGVTGCCYCSVCSYAVCFQFCFWHALLSELIFLKSLIILWSVGWTRPIQLLHAVRSKTNQTNWLMTLIFYSHMK